MKVLCIGKIIFDCKNTKFEILIRYFDYWVQIFTYNNELFIDYKLMQHSLNVKSWDINKKDKNLNSKNNT